MKKVFNFLKYVFFVVFLPLSLVNAIYQYFKFKKTLRLIHNVVNTDQDFYNFLEKYEFIPDWIGRLYSPQPIPKIFKDFTEDELYDVVMRTIRTSIVPIFERNNIIDVGAITVVRLNDESYIMTITTYWQKTFIESLKLLAYSFAFTIFAFVIYLVMM